MRRHPSFVVASTALSIVPSNVVVRWASSTKSRVGLPTPPRPRGQTASAAAGAAEVVSTPSDEAPRPFKVLTAKPKGRKPSNITSNAATNNVPVGVQLPTLGESHTANAPAPTTASAIAAAASGGNLDSTTTYVRLQHHFASHLFPTATSPNTTATLPVILLCHWTSESAWLTITHLESGAVLKTNPERIYDVFGPWFDQQRKSSAQSKSSATSSSSVWLVPNFATPQGIAVQSFLRNGVQRRAEVTNGEALRQRERVRARALVKERGTGAAAQDVDAAPASWGLWLPEDHRAVVSLRQLVASSRLEAQWRLRTESDSRAFLDFVAVKWGPVEWGTHLGKQSFLASWNAIPTKATAPANGTAPISTIPPPAGATGIATVAANTAGARSTPPTKTASPPALHPTAAAVQSRIGSVLGSPNSGVSTLVYVVGTLRDSLHICQLGMTTPVPSDELLASLLTPTTTSSPLSVTSPVFFAASEQAVELLRQYKFLHHETVATTTTSGNAAGPMSLHHYRPFLVRLCDVEVAVHTAVLGCAPSFNSETSAASPAAPSHSPAPASAWNRHRVDRRFLYKAVGVVNLLDAARAHLTDQEWRLLIRTGSDMVPIKSLDVNPEKLEVNIKHKKMTAHADALEAKLGDSDSTMNDKNVARLHQYRQDPRHRQLRTLDPSGKLGSTISPTSALDSHLKHLYQSPVRRLLELAALRDALPQPTDAHHVLCVHVDTSEAEYLGRRDHPFYEGNAVRRVVCDALQFTTAPQSATSARSSASAEWMQQRWPVVLHKTTHVAGPSAGARGEPATSTTLESLWRRRQSACGDVDTVVSRTRVVVMADAKRGLTFLRKDPLFLNQLYLPPTTTTTNTNATRIWCVLYAQHILSGFRQKFLTLADVAAQYAPMPNDSGATFSDRHTTELLAYVYEQQVAAGAAGRVLLSMRERMEGLLASTMMEVNGIAIDTNDAVEEAQNVVGKEKAENDVVLSQYAGKWFIGAARTNFNWQSQSDVAAALYGGGLVKLLGGNKAKQSSHPTQEIMSSNSVGAAIKKPQLHRYLLEAFGVNPSLMMNATSDHHLHHSSSSPSSSGGDHQLQSLPPYEMYRPESLQPHERQAALDFLCKKTTFVVVSLRTLRDNITIASVFVPAGPDVGGGQLIIARLFTDEVRSLTTAVAATKMAGGSADDHGTVGVLRAEFKQGAAPANCDEKTLPLLSLVQFRDALRSNALLRTLRNHAAAAVLDHTTTEVQSSGEEPHQPQGPTSTIRERRTQRETSTLEGHPLERIASCPPNVVFVVGDEDATRQVVHGIESCIVQTICEVLEIANDECVSFVPASAVAVAPPATAAPSESSSSNVSGSSAVPNFAQDFEELERVASWDGGFRNALEVWLQQVLGCFEGTPMSIAQQQPGVSSSKHTIAVAGNGGASSPMPFHILSVKLLQSLHDNMVQQWVSSRTASSFPYINLEMHISTALPRQWLRNHSAMMHPQQQLYLEGHLWESIRTSFASDKAKRAEMCDAVEQITQRFGTGILHPGSGGVTSVNGDVLERLAALWTSNGMDASLLKSLLLQRSNAKLLNLFQPNRLLRCGMTCEAGQSGGVQASGEEAVVRVVHPYIDHQGTNTGRLSSQNPCVHNLPKHPLVRNLFVSRFGANNGVLVEADYSQLEVVALALLAGDVQMMKELKNAIDFHCLRVSLMTKEPYDDVVRKAKKYKDPKYVALRQQAKVFSFQRQYGAGVAALSSTTGMSPADIQSLIAAEESHYPQLTAYYKQVEACVRLGAASIAARFRPDLVPRSPGSTPFADARLVNLRTRVEPHKYYPVLTGIKFDFSTNQTTPNLKNHPVQGFAGELVQIACGRLIRHLHRHAGLRTTIAAGQQQHHLAYLTNSVHDCVWVDCRDDVADVVTQVVRENMESICATLTTTFWQGGSSDLAHLTPAEMKELQEHHSLCGNVPWWQPDLPFPVTVHRGKTLGDLLD